MYVYGDVRANSDCERLLSMMIIIFMLTRNEQTEVLPKVGGRMYMCASMSVLGVGVVECIGRDRTNKLKAL